MNYQKHYDLLCERAKERGEPEGYFERHHVQPKCLGGSDEESNIVKLTPEEHYLAHQLLVKMHPDHDGLIWAALQMTGQPNGKRSTNKIYGWLKRKWSHIAKARRGKKNGSYGRHWYHHPDTLETIKCLPDETPKGFIKGRVTKDSRVCKSCGTSFKVVPSRPEIYCSADCRKIAKSSMIAKRNKERRIKLEPELIEDLVYRYELGESVSKIHQDYGVSQRKAYYLIKEHRGG